MGFLTIGELARRTGLTTRTIRFYSDEGLLPPADRTHAGYRLYDGESLARLELLRTLRELGLGLPDASAALAGKSSVADLARRHVALLDEQIRVLRLRRAVLRAIARTEAELDEVRLMKNLATMTDAERAALIDDFWNEVNAGLDINPDFDAGMRSAKPVLPDDPTPEQLEAWIELAELVQDKDFRARIRAMSEGHAEAREAGESMDMPSPETQEQWKGWTARAAVAREAGEEPGSATGQELAAEIVAAFGASREEVAERMALSTDGRAERYWQLMATINGWPQWPEQVPNAEWLVAALRS
ncbi:DNA-binding transcriptional MerR regulator [Actinophytocola algeriensis]|uniref:DNA-binding transcriptional MerR regulator n=2 Tax=Actinophytocola algeriensis TaxID=1768010 RepID=A0A7W7Q523_9PSEU|nr:MerR family transcriptional regulator [Actinophytocola algeriensis]MBB4907220.1 DNA-binding transcriptional MerR regulator [Actinophytocola algeriensis]MBE1478703.1 DNA-binding transcriptional MerR regulator [Actinophytocola algeriensis]